MPPASAFGGWLPTCYYGLLTDAAGEFRPFALSTPDLHPQIVTLLVRAR